MKKKLILLVAAMLAAFGAAAQQSAVRYLTDVAKPAENSDYLHLVPHSTKAGADKIHMGGLEWDGGFVIRYTVGPYRAGQATFNLGGKYEKLLFVLGITGDREGSHGPFPSLSDGGVVAVYADGRRVVDRVIQSWHAPCRMELDVAGVNELRFELVQGEYYVAIAEATLWTAGQKPRQTGNLLPAQLQMRQLVKDIRPYFIRKAEPVGPTGDDERKEIKINGTTYTSGLVLDANVALMGTNVGRSYFYLQGGYRKVSFVAGPVDSDARGNGWLAVKADGKMIYEKEIFYDGLAESVVLDIPGCNELCFESESEDGQLKIGVADIKVWPEGAEPEVPQSKAAASPDVCKLISTIPPYATSSAVEDCVYDGRSDHITFSMGGERFSEGIALRGKANMIYGNSGAHAAFDLGGQYDYVSFTTGWIGKSVVMKDDTLNVYADDALIAKLALQCTAPNRHHELPLNRCRQLRFELQGYDSMFRPAFGVADIVVYRGKVVPNDLFVHPKPDCPPQKDLIDLGLPYIHYIYNGDEATDAGALLDGSTMRRYFNLDGQRINKGFLLQSKVHLTLDVGDNDAGAIVALNFIGFTPLALAAAGIAYDSSLAAFNTFGEYDRLTFKVACLDGHNPTTKDPRSKEMLYIGADGNLAKEITLTETMPPTEISVPLNRCGQLMFWLKCGEDTSGKYLFYDLVLHKD